MSPNYVSAGEVLYLFLTIGGDSPERSEAARARHGLTELTRRSRMRRPGRSRERGAAAVEFALVLPVLILLIGGIIDFGRAYFTQIVLTNAAREGARAAVVRADPVARANAARTGISDADWRTVVVSTGACTASPTPTQVEVTTSANFDYFFLGMVPGITDPTVLSSKAVMGCS